MDDPPANPHLSISASCEATDGELVQQTLDGRKEAFDELVRRYQRQAVAVAYRLLNNRSDAMDVTQDAYVKAYTRLDTLQTPEAFAGWLMRIVTRLSLNYRRGRALRIMPSLDQSPDPSPADSSAIDPPHRLAGRELGESLNRALKQLPDKQRLALVLFTMEKMPQKQIAEIMECSVEAVKWHVFQGRKKLKEMLKDQL